MLILEKFRKNYHLLYFKTKHLLKLQAAFVIYNYVNEILYIVYIIYLLPTNYVNFYKLYN